MAPVLPRSSTITGYIVRYRHVAQMSWAGCPSISVRTLSICIYLSYRVGSVRSCRWALRYVDKILTTALLNVAVCRFLSEKDHKFVISWGGWAPSLNWHTRPPSISSFSR